MKYLYKDTWLMKLDKPCVMLTMSELKTLIDTAHGLSRDVLNMRRSLPERYPSDTKGTVNNPIFKKPFVDAVNKSNKLEDIKNIVTTNVKTGEIESRKD